MNYKKLFFEAAQFSDEYDEEKKFRNYIEYVLLRARGFKPYAEELCRYIVNFLDPIEAVSMEIEIAAIDVQSKIIYITQDVMDQLNNAATPEEHKYAEDQLSMLLRHELLHSILRHQYRTNIYIAKKLGFPDPIHLTKEQYEEVLKYKNQPALLTGGMVTLSNYAGDLDLSRNYLERDKEITRKLGGLLMDDHPDWAGYSFERLLETVTKIEEEIKSRFERTIYGTMDQTTGEFETQYEEPSFFETATEFAPQDVSTIDLITPEEYAMVKSYLPGYKDIWLKSEPQLDHGTISYTEAWGGRFYQLDAITRALVIPTFKVDNINYYDQLRNKYNGGNDIIPFKCLGQDVLVVIEDKRVKCIVSKDSIFNSIYQVPMIIEDEDDLEDIDFQDTELYDALQNWFKSQKAKYR